MQPTRVIAVDWSGARTGAHRKIWWAEVTADGVVQLANGRGRGAVTETLVARLSAARAAGERVVAGLDFAFGFPAWFAAEHWTEPAGAWSWWTDARVEAALAGTLPPFWGRGAAPKRPSALADPALAYRRTEADVAAAFGVRPGSVFQTIGAGAVGTGTLRGMATLRALHAAGIPVWPFVDDPGRGPVVCELWPRLFAPAVPKVRADARRAAATAALHGAGIASAPALADHVEAAAGSDDAFDALVAACGLWRWRARLRRLPGARDATARREGRIWAPPAPGAGGPAPD